MISKSTFNVEILENEQKEVVIYNTLSQAIVKLPVEKWKEIDSCSNEEINCLRDEGIIHLSEKNERQELFDALKEEQERGSKILEITIVPTYFCNMKCKYCFQQERKDILDNDKADSIINTIIQVLGVKKYEQLKVSWFGGEPLLAIDIIEYISNSLIRYCDEYEIKYLCDFVTNGTLISDDIINRLVNMHTYAVQITLDGLNHDSTRIMKDGSCSYELIKNNILAISKKIPTAIRSNVSADNRNSICGMMDDIMNSTNCDSDNIQNIYFSFYPITDFSKESKVADFDGYCGKNEFNEFLIPLIDKASEYVPLEQICNLTLQASVMPCSVLYRDYFCIDVYGDVYKCSLAMSQKRFVIGNIFQSKINDILSDTPKHREWTDFVWDEDCAECPLLPMCHSGCICEKKMDNVKHVCSMKMVTLKSVLKYIYLKSEE